MIKTKVLLIEDDYDLAQMLIRKFARIAPNIEIVLCESVDETITMLQARPIQRIDAVVLDIRMAPGTEFKNFDTRAGTWTGVLLYKRLGAWYELFDSTWPPLPIAIHTNMIRAESVSANELSEFDPSPESLRGDHIDERAESLTAYIDKLHELVWPQLPIKYFPKPILAGDFVSGFIDWVNCIKSPPNLDITLKDSAEGEGPGGGRTGKGQQSQIEQTLF